jgi:thiamine kinase-like enzyme
LTKLVEVYRNLHKHCWSIRDKRTKKVIRHLQEVTLEGAIFVVREAGRKRVLKEKRKNVHAWVTGTLVSNRAVRARKGREITYNPYLYNSFVLSKSKAKVKSSPLVKLTKDGRVFILTKKEVPYSNLSMEM